VTIRTLLAVTAAALIGCGSALGGSFKVGIVDAHPIPAVDVSALGVTYSRITLRWQGESSYAGTLYFTPGTSPVLLVGMVYDSPPQSAGERTAYCNFVRTVLQRYPQIKNVIVWGEPSTPDFTWYGQLLRDCSPMIRSFGARVIGPAIGPWTLAKPMKLLAAIKSAGPHLIDAIAADPYYGIGSLANFVKTTRAALGWHVPVWVAEDGIDTVPDAPFANLYVGATPATWHYWTTEANQATVVAAHMRYSYCAGVSVWMNFLLRDEQDLARWQSGLERPDGSHKAAYWTFAATARDIAAGRVACPSSPQQSPPPPRWTPDERLAQRLAETGGWTRDAYSR
jgi:hypothetical protein